jgi:hypothetical protein
LQFTVASFSRIKSSTTVSPIAIKSYCMLALYNSQ